MAAPGSESGRQAPAAMAGPGTVTVGGDMITGPRRAAAAGAAIPSPTV